jgi:hypothetical protein
MLLDEGYRPARTVYLAFGHDEEVGGTRGARAIAALLKNRGGDFEMVLDEGGVIGPRLPLARRAVFANLRLTRPIVMRRLDSSAATHAMVRTTTAWS